MFKKVHTRLYVLCGSITTCILIIMSLLYLFVSEDNLRTSTFTSFQSDMNTITMNMEQQLVISRQWLNNLNTNKNYMIQIRDNHIPFLFNQLTSNETNTFLFDEVSKRYADFYETYYTSLTPYQTIHEEFIFESANGNTYFTSIMLLERNSNPLEMILLADTNKLKEQITTQRIYFGLIILVTTLLLWIFSYIFTKKLLQPIQQSQEEQSAFISAASHELRTPLAVIQSSISASKESSRIEQEQLLNVIQNESERMGKLVDDMLTLSRADNTSWTMNFSTYAADVLLLNTYESFEAICRERGLHLSISLPEEEIPDISCDKIRLEQVLSILLNNAISYTPAKGTISLVLSYDSRSFLFQVIDSGIGIPKEERENVFKRFYRIDKSRTITNHCGLGLSIAHEIIVAHNGKILISDSPNVGTTFTIKLPSL